MNDDLENIQTLQLKSNQHLSLWPKRRLRRSPAIFAWVFLVPLPPPKSLWTRNRTVLWLSCYWEPIRWFGRSRRSTSTKDRETLHMLEHFWIFVGEEKVLWMNAGDGGGRKEGMLHMVSQRQRVPMRQQGGSRIVFDLSLIPLVVAYDDFLFVCLFSWAANGFCLQINNVRILNWIIMKKRMKNRFSRPLQRRMNHMSIDMVDGG